MIDTRDHLGVPVITDCPTYVERDGVRYEIPADALVTRESELPAQSVDETLYIPTTDWQRTYLATAIHTPRLFFSASNA